MKLQNTHTKYARHSRQVGMTPNCREVLFHSKNWVPPVVYVQSKAYCMYQAKQPHQSCGLQWCSRERHCKDHVGSHDHHHHWKQRDKKRRMRPKQTTKGRLPERKKKSLDPARGKKARRHRSVRHTITSRFGEGSFASFVASRAICSKASTSTRGGKASGTRLNSCSHPARANLKIGRTIPFSCLPHEEFENARRRLGK